MCRYGVIEVWSVGAPERRREVVMCRYGVIEVWSVWSSREKERGQVT